MHEAFKEFLYLKFFVGVKACPQFVHSAKSLIFFRKLNNIKYLANRGTYFESRFPSQNQKATPRGGFLFCSGIPRAKNQRSASAPPPYSIGRSPLSMRRSCRTLFSSFIS